MNRIKIFAICILFAAVSVLFVGNKTEFYAQNIRIPVLAYHSVMPREFYYPINVDNPWILLEDTFYLQMRYLYENGFNSVTSQQLTDFLFNSGELPPNPVVLTFDDGYLDNALFAAPILRQFGFTAMQFLITSNIAETTPQMAAYPIQFMSESEILANTDVFEFGSHTHDMHRSVRGRPLLATESVGNIKADILYSFNFPLTFTNGFRTLCGVGDDKKLFDFGGAIVVIICGLLPQ